MRHIRFSIRAAALAVLLGSILGAAPALAITTEALLDTLQHTAFNYFWIEANPSNGLIKDRDAVGAPCSIASVGFGLSAICIGIDRGWVSRTDGGNRVLTTLQTLWTKPQGSSASGNIGYKGLFYHFLDMNSATRTWDSELSTIDTALLFAGVIDTKQYFDTGDPLDIQIRALADSIYHRADWNFVRNLQPAIHMGWKPGTGFSGFGFWIGYNEAMILYILALGSPTHPVPETCWTSWTSGYDWQTHYGYTYINFQPLFGHQYSHCWIDFAEIHDAYTSSHDITYFENTRRATLAAREYCIANPLGHSGYGENVWGLTAGDGPGGYNARGAPPGQNDDGTITPTAALSSLPFAPEVVLPTMHHLWDTYRGPLWGPYGFRDGFNLEQFWWATDVIGIDQGPIIVMIENYRSGAVWERFMANADIQMGLQRAGFTSTLGVPGDQEGSASWTLFQNRPNPAGGVSYVPFRLEEPGEVLLRLFDVSGREVRKLASGRWAAGSHEVPLDTAGLPGGVYFYRLETGGKAQSRRCVVIP